MNIRRLSSFILASRHDKHQSQHLESWGKKGQENFRVHHKVSSGARGQYESQQVLRTTVRDSIVTHKTQNQHLLAAVQELQADSRRRVGWAYLGSGLQAFAQCWRSNQQGWSSDHTGRTWLFLDATELHQRGWQEKSRKAQLRHAVELAKECITFNFHVKSSTRNMRELWMAFPLYLGASSRRDGKPDGRTMELPTTITAVQKWRTFVSSCVP